MKAILASLLFVTITLAGCSGGGGGGDASIDPTIRDPSQLDKGKGAIAGLLLDDGFRPIPQGKVLVEQTGEVVTSNADGEFYVLNVDPGSYRLRAQVPGHEALPLIVTVAEGVYEDARVIARRVVSEGGTIITREFSVFIPCAADFVVNGVVANCMLDLSGDSYRAGFTVNTTDLQNVTYLVTEMKANAVGDYVVQVRRNDPARGDGAAGGPRYAVGTIIAGDYIKMVNAFGVVNEEHNDQANNVPWNNTNPYQTILFMQGEYQEEFSGIGENVAGTCVPGAVCLNNPTSRGLGAQFGIKATFIQSIFLGEPDVDIDRYQAMS